MIVSPLSPQQRAKQDIRNVLTAHSAFRHRYVDWAVDLVVSHKWTVRCCTDGIVSASRETREMWVTPIDSDEALAMFCHEGGHLEDLVADEHAAIILRNGVAHHHSFPAEIRAWQWALRTLGRRWTSGMQATMADCLDSYTSRLRGDGYIVSDPDRPHASREDNLLALRQLLADGEEAARHIVRIGSTPGV